MWWRLPRAQFNAQKGEKNRRALKKIVQAGEVPGLLAYVDGRPIGWCAVGPREGYTALERSRILKPVDDEPVWSVVCFFVAKEFRRQGVTVGLLTAAAEHARKMGATVLEGYPNDLSKGDLPDPFVYTGLAGAFRRAGFVEVARRSAKRPIMRLALNANRKSRSAGRRLAGEANPV